MPGIRENSLSKKRRQDSVTNNEPVDIALLRRQPTEELGTTSDKHNGSRRDDALNRQATNRKSQRSHAAHSVRQATMKLSTRTSNKSLPPSTITKKGMHKPTKAFSAPEVKQSKRLVTKQKSLQAVSKRLSNESVTLSTPNTKTGNNDTDFSRISKKSSTVAKVPAQRGKNTGKQLWFPGKAFLAVRASDDDQYYICRSRTRVYNTTRQVPVTWLTLQRKRLQGLRKSHNAPVEYRISYKDVVDPTAILMEVSLDRISRLVYTLSRDQKTEIERLVKLAQAVEQGDININNIGDDVEEAVLIDEPQPKKPRLQKSASEKLRAKEKKLLLKKAGSKSKPTKESKKKSTKGSAEPKRKKPNKKEAALELHPRDDIAVQEEDPLFETDCQLPYVSKVANSRLVFRAIHLKNNKKLTKLLKDGSFIYELYTKSVDNPETPYEAAVKVKDTAILETILQEFLGTNFNNRRKNNRHDPCRIDKLGTGRYNPTSLGVGFIRKITASRGSREGNNAFTEDEQVVEYYTRQVVCSLFKAGLNDAQLAVLEKCIKSKKPGNIHVFDVLLRDDVCDLLLVGQHLAAGHIIEADLKSGRSGFNSLFKDVLLLTTEELKNCPPSACKQSIKRVSKLSPYHCAAANPNSKYLAKLLSVEPDVHISDAKGRRPIHYAAGCSSPDTLKLLLKWGANISDTDSTRCIPLHYAIKANRSKNVKILLEHNKTDGEHYLASEKFGVGGANRRTTDSLTPLHYAAKHGFLEIAELLLKHGADVNAKLSVSAKQSTPLMLAAASGNLSMARLLVGHGAVVEQQDRMGCTALIYACKNGATSILTYFLRLGARADRADNSGNTPLHYAAAYGWLFTMKTLLDAGVDPNVHNMWRTTPVSVAYFKSHYGIVQELLTHSKADINFTDDDGMSLLFHACGSDLSERDLCEEITYMIEEKGARCDILDNMGRSPLHHLTKAEVSKDTDRDKNREEKDKRQRQALLQSVDIARILIKNGCPLNAVDQDGVTAAMAAVGRGHNYPLAEYLLSVGGNIATPPIIPGECPPSTVMHELASNIWSASGNLTAITSLLKNKKHRDQVVKMCCMVDSDGFTPLSRACFFARRGSYQPYPVTVFSANASHSNYLHHTQSRINPWIPVREFIRALVTVFHADPNAEVKEKYFHPDDMPSPSSDTWWYKTDLAKKTPAHIVLFESDPDLTDEGDALPELNKHNAGYMFRDLVNFGADVNTRDFQGMTLLGSCIKEERVDLLEFLKTKTDCDFNMPIKIRKGDEVEEIHPLLYASRRGKQSDSSLSMVNGLIDCGSDVNVTMSDTVMKCLHLLVIHFKSHTLEAVDKLAEKGYDFNSKDKVGRTALHYAVRAHTGNMAASMELEVKLLQLGSDPGLQDARGRTVLHYIFIPVANQSTYRYQYGISNQSSKGDPTEMTQLISRNMRKSQINLQDKDGKTALHFAAEHGAAICCMYLTMVGAEPNIKDNDGNTALALAVQNKFDGCAINLIQGGASLKSKVVIFSAKEIQRRKALEDKQDQNEEKEDKEEEEEVDEEDEEKEEEEEDSHPEYWVWQPARLIIEEEAVREVQLYQAALENKLNGVAMFITGADEHSSGLSFLDAIQIAFKTCIYQTGLRLLQTITDLTVVNQPLECGRTLLHSLSISCEKNENKKDPTLLKLAELIVKAGLRPDALDDFGCSPVQYAVLHRHFDLADFLAEKSGGYDVKYHDSMGRSHLAALLWRAHSLGIGDMDTWNFMNKLTGNKIDLDQLFDLPLNSELVALNVRQNTKEDPNYFSEYLKNKTTALIVCVKSNEFSLAKKLLNSGANPNTPDGEGLSPLMHAIQMNQVNFVKLLLNFDFDPDKKGEEKKKTNAKKWNNVTSAFKLKAGRNIDFNDDGDEDEEKEEEEGEEEGEDEEEEEDDSEEENSEEEEEQKEPLKQTSSVNLDQKDKEGRTALHYVAQTHSEGTFDNGEIASLLIQNGCGLLRNKKGFSAHQEALQSGAASVARLLKAKFKLSSEKSKPPSDKHQPEPVNDGVPAKVNTWPDVDKAAHQVLRRHTSEQDKPTYVHTVDPNCDVKNGELVKDENSGRFYDVLMTKVDVKRGDWGVYNFYQIQLVYQPNKDLYILFTRWGRIEDDGQFQHTPFTDRKAAVNEFAKVFKEKSGNKWEDINEYEQKPRKYRLVEDVARQAPPPQKDIDIDLSSNVTSDLPKHLARVVEILMDPKSMKRSMEKTDDLDTLSLPFGQLNKERLLQGQKLLQQIENHVDDLDKYLAKEDKTNEDKESYHQNLEKIADLSNDYFHVIPQRNYSCEQLRPLDQRHRLATQIYNVSNLLHYQDACKLVLAAMWHKQDYNPVDFVYHSMGCKIQLMDQNDFMAQMILKYIRSYKEKAHNVKAIFCLERKVEKERRKASKIQGERRLLWHGTSTCNLLSILHRGLVVSPPEADSSGSRFGKGIYFSDAFSFSADYVNSSEAKFMLLCEVAMGEVIDHVKELKKEEGYPMLQPNLSFTRNEKVADTIMVRGDNHYCTSDWLILSTGERLPLGKTKHKYSPGGTDHTQYVVRDPAAVTLRYLVQYS